MPLSAKTAHGPWRVARRSGSAVWTWRCVTWVPRRWLNFCMRHLLTCGSVNDGNSTLQLSCSHLGALARQDARLRDLAGAPVPKAEQRCIGFLFWMSEDAKDRVYRVAPRIRGGTVMGWSPPGNVSLLLPWRWVLASTFFCGDGDGMDLGTGNSALRSIWATAQWRRDLIPGQSESHDPWDLSVPRRGSRMPRIPPCRWNPVRCVQACTP